MSWIPFIAKIEARDMGLAMLDQAIKQYPPLVMEADHIGVYSNGDIRTYIRNLHENKM